MDRERLPEQEEVLAEIASVCDEKDVDVVLIAGDVFDTYTPPAEAEELFFRTVKALAKDRRAVVAVSGNHDDGMRLCASAPVAEQNGVYLFGGTGRVPVTGGERPVIAERAGENYLILKKGEERLYLNVLPYPNEAKLREDRTDEPYAEKTKRRIEAGDACYDGTMPHILLSHLFMAGGSVSDGERDISLGGARAVPSGYFPQFGYTALGHLHKKQGTGNIRYSGSILPYSFDEAGTEKEVILLETRGTEVAVLEEIPLRAGKRLVRLEARGLDEAVRLLTCNEGKLAELTVHLEEPLTAGDMQRLRAASDGLVSVIPRVRSEEAETLVGRSELKADELFLEFYRKTYGTDPSEKLKETFLRLLGEDA